jgi:PKHD-type hydroxylase
MKENYQFPLKYNDPCQFYWFNRGFSKEELDIIYNDLSQIPFERASVVNDDLKIRRSNIKWIPQNDQWRWLYEKLINMAVEANDALWGFDLHTAPEMIQYTEYDADELGHYGWHQDIGPGLPSVRKVSITVQLSDSYEYEGGDLKIWLGGEIDNSSVGPRGAGNVVIFPSYMPHCVDPVTKGTRKSFVLWLGGAHYK